VDTNTPREWMLEKFSRPEEAKPYFSFTRAL
jgi:hypothetical protein